MNFKDKLLDLIKENNYDYKTLKDFAEILELSSKFDIDNIKLALSELEKSGELILTKRNKYVRPEVMGLIKGKISGNERGFGFLVPENREIKDHFIPGNALNGALHGDTVLVMEREGTRGSSDEAEVVKIISRGYEKIVGTYFDSKDFGFVVADEKKYFVDVFIPKKFNMNAQNGDKVLAVITNYPENRKNPEGIITEIIGKKGEENDELAIIRGKDINIEFPPAVLNAVAKIPQDLRPEDFFGRTDLRYLTTFTIDGEDARDLDDAVSISKLSSGAYLLGVHIADVSAYVKSNSPIDKEAFDRGTSIYFPDMVIPMLPKELSNGICSLNGGKDRLTLSVLMTIDKSGTVIDREIVEGIINTRHRMTYTAVTKMIDGDDKTIDEYKDILPDVLLMKELAEILIEKRDIRGSVNLEMKEATIMLDVAGNITIEELKRSISHRMIEEFMIVCNETVAEYMFYLDLPFVYRVHEKPSEEKANAFLAFIKELGISTKRIVADNLYPKDYQDILDMLEGESVYPVVNRVMLRSMQKAKYYPENLGHFGLASKFYCHFTSPIRRYPDLTIHRIIKSVLNGKIADRINYFERLVEEASLQSSLRERVADEVERDVDDLYKARYMQKYIGENFEGVISGVTSFGIFVELKNTVEGLVKMDNLPQDNYVLEAEKFTLNGMNHKYKIGQEVEITVAGVDMGMKKIEFVLVG